MYLYYHDARMIRIMLIMTLTINSISNTPTDTVNPIKTLWLLSYDVVLLAERLTYAFFIKVIIIIHYTYLRTQVFC